MPTITQETPQQFFDPQPEETDVVIIGGGVIGVCTALYLAEQGIRCVVCEKGRIAGEQSSRNWGWVRQLGRDAAELPIMMESNRIWRGLAERIGEDVGFESHGICYLSEDESKLETDARFQDIAKAHGLATKILSRAEVEARIDSPPGQWFGAICCESDGRAEPWLAVPAMARAAQRQGARVIENCAVRALDLAAGRSAGVITELGRVKAQRVVLAGGAWSSLFARNSGITLPQLSVRATVARTAATTWNFAGNAADGKLGFRRRQDGGFTLALTDYHDHFMGPDSLACSSTFAPALAGSIRHTRIRLAAPEGYPDAWNTPRRWQADQITPFERMRVLNPPPSPGAVERIAERLNARLPAMADVPVIDAWAGMIDAMPDTVPVMDEVAQARGLFLATGFSGHGFGIGPAAGRIVADMVQGKRPEHDLSRFRFSRFTDGSKLTLGPSL